MIRTSSAPRSAHLRLLSVSRRRFTVCRPCADVESKYAELLQRRAEEQGTSVSELRSRAVEAAKAQPKEVPTWLAQQAATKSALSSGPRLPLKERTDSSPVRPLSSLMDFHRLFREPHTAAQVSALWTAYHATKSSGTGRGYMSASVPLETYLKMLHTAKKFPTFLLPLKRTGAAAPSDADSASTEEGGHDFHYLQWDLHEIPPPPHKMLAHFPYFAPAPTDPLPPNPPLSTVLFTPLQEYKLRQSYATPELLITHYTDLAHTHGLVLLRGELTPSANGQYMLTQQEAHLLAMGVQWFYLASSEGTNNDEKDRAEMLSTFHLQPNEFRWQDLLKHVVDPVK